MNINPKSARASVHARPASVRPSMPGRVNMSHAGSIPEGQPGKPDTSADLLSALSGLEANRERAVAHRTRRVVLGSLGLLNEEKQDRSRARGVAIAIAIVAVLVITPLIWEAVDIFIAGEHPGDPVGQLILWACLACPSLLAAVLVAGWWKRRS